MGLSFETFPGDHLLQLMGAAFVLLRTGLVDFAFRLGGSNDEMIFRVASKKALWWESLRGSIQQSLIDHSLSANVRGLPRCG